MNNVVIVLGEQQSNLAIYICLSIHPQTSLLSRLTHNIGQSSMCYTVDFCWLYILNITVCILSSQSPNHPFPWQP